MGLQIESFAFEIGGEQITRFSPGNGEIYVNGNRYHDIVPGVRIVSSGAMTRGPDTLFAGVLTVELEPAGSGCLLRLTEQGVFLDGRDQPDNHALGWRAMLDKLARQLDTSAAARRPDDGRPRNSIMRRACIREKRARSRGTSGRRSNSSSSILAAASTGRALSSD